MTGPERKALEHRAETIGPRARRLVELQDMGTALPKFADGKPQLSVEGIFGR